jgi:methionyl-tRNA formyltransferase
MKPQRFVFVGNRRFVLEQMLADRVHLEAVIVVAGSHLERDLAGDLSTALPKVIVVRSKKDLLDALQVLDYEVFLSNGCPYILPVQQLPAAKYVNIHPSCLPDLRGIDPVIGSILFRRDSGATCHVMDAGIDTGPIISQVRIPYTDDLDVITLYQLSFIAEKQVFSQALARAFEPAYEQTLQEDLLYYSRRPEDRTITFREPNSEIIQKTKAFSNLSQGCFFFAAGRRFRVQRSEILNNSFLRSHVLSCPELTVALLHEDGIIFHKDADVICFDRIRPVEDGALSVGDSLGQE